MPHAVCSSGLFDLVIKDTEHRIFGQYVATLCAVYSATLRYRFH